MGAEQGRVETDAGDPRQQQAGILAGGEAAVPGTVTMEQKIAGTLPDRRKVFVDRLPRLLVIVEPDRTTGFALPNGRTVDLIAMWCDVFDLDAHQVAFA
jgi:hypothetical protein